MKKRKRNLRVLGVLAGFFFVVLFLGGCETCKGFGRDIASLRDTDDWLREHFW